MEEPLILEDWVIDHVNGMFKLELKRSTCTKRQLAAVVWSLDGFFKGGSNGPPTCFKDFCEPCPRARSKHGENLEVCPAVHGEMSAILNAATEGMVTDGAALFITCALPCKDCMKEIIAAGIKHIISPYDIEYVMSRESDDAKWYNFRLSRMMMEQCGVQYIHEPRLLKSR